MPRLLIALLCCLPLCGAPASAQENDALFVHGSLRCDDWDRYPALHDWTLSFIVRENRGYRINILDRVTSVQILREIGRYCQRRPLDGLAVAALELMNDLAAGAIK
jgi:hypothetical protein